MILALLLALCAMRTDAKKVGLLDDFEIKMPVNINLADNFTPQAENVPYPGVYETKVVTPIRRDDDFFYLNEIKFNEFLIYPGNDKIINRSVVLTTPKDGHYFAMISTDYVFETDVQETIEFYKTPDMPGFAENVTKPIDVDLRQINQLPLVIEIRTESATKFEIYISDIFKPFVKIGRIMIGDYVIDGLVWETVYRSFTAEYNLDFTVDISVMSIMRSGPRRRAKYKIKVIGPNDESSVIGQSDSG